MDDVALIAAARGGDRAAIDELLARYEPSIYRFGLRMQIQALDMDAVRTEVAKHVGLQATGTTGR